MTRASPQVLAMLFCFWRSVVCCREQKAHEGMAVVAYQAEQSKPAVCLEFASVVSLFILEVEITMLENSKSRPVRML